MPSHWLQQTVPELLAGFQQQAGHAVHAFFLVKLFKNDKNGHKLVMFKDEDDKLDLPGFHAYLSGDGKKTSTNSSVQALAIEMLKEPLINNTIGNLQFADLLDTTPLVINDSIDEIDGVTTRNMTISLTLFGDIETDAEDWKLSRLLDASSPQGYETYGSAEWFSLAPLKAMTGERLTTFIENIYSRRAHLTKNAFMARNNDDVLETQTLLYNMATSALAIKMAEFKDEFQEPGSGFFGVKQDKSPRPTVTVFCFNENNEANFDGTFADDMTIGKATFTNLMTFAWKAGKVTSFDVRARARGFALETLIDRDGRMVVEWKDLVEKRRVTIEVEHGRGADEAEHGRVEEPEQGEMEDEADTEADEEDDEEEGEEGDPLQGFLRKVKKQLDKEAKKEAKKRRRQAGM